MRTPSLAAAAITTTSLLAVSPIATAQTADRYYYSAPRPSAAHREARIRHEREVCEERAEAADRTGEFRGYPCWAREAFGRGRSRGHGR